VGFVKKNKTAASVKQENSIITTKV